MASSYFLHPTSIRFETYHLLYTSSDTQIPPVYWMMCRWYILKYGRKIEIGERQQLLMKIQFNIPTNYSIEQKINRISDFFDRIRIRGINTITHFSYWSSLVWWTRYPGVTFIDFIFLYAITDTTFTWKNIPCWQIKLESIVSITIQYWIGYVYFAIIVDSFLQ